MLACLTDQREELEGMRQIWRDQHKVAILIPANMITHKTHATAADGKGQFEFRVVVPVEGKLWQAAIKDQQRAIRRDRHCLEIGGAMDIAYTEMG